jgi:hypothetical protein
LGGAALSGGNVGGAGGKFGGGSGGCSGAGNGGGYTAGLYPNTGSGAVRIIWGGTRAYPDTNTQNY